MATKLAATDIRSANDAEIERTLLEVIKRSSADPEFRQLALRDSSAAINQVDAKLQLKGVEVRFVEGSTAWTRTLNLTVPLPDPVSSTAELTDAELQEVSGGRTSGCWLTCLLTSKS